MNANGFRFQLDHLDAGCGARLATLCTPHGEVSLPAFMPVATRGTVKGVNVEQLRQSGAQMLLGNAYHLALKPGSDVVRRLGGLHQMMGWQGPILTDSGGFQIFSLARLTRVEEQGATFQSHIDGSKMVMTPERSIQIQEELGSDIAMVLDHVVGLPAEKPLLEEACQRTVRWAERSLQAACREDQALFAIVQGGLDADLRRECSEQLVALDFPGYAIGGLSVGETPEQMQQMLNVTCPLLPADKPRYLMGVGRPLDLLEAIRRGVDMFDCVMPTRNGRNAMAFTDQGPVKMRNRVHQEEIRPLEEDCPCPACRHSRGYLRHLFVAGEMLGPVLLSLHNLTYYQRLLAGARQAIAEDRLVEFIDQKKAGWGLVEVGED
ncbi:MAG: tRNA guanosine(34) transglycosylase Tgt [Pirellulaceae bacterium]